MLLEHLKVKGYSVGRMLAMGERLVVGGQFFHEVAHAFGIALILRRPSRGRKEAQQAFLVLLMVFTCDISFTKVLGVPYGKFDWFRSHGYSPLTWCMRRNIVRTYWEKFTVHPQNLWVKNEVPSLQPVPERWRGFGSWISSPNVMLCRKRYITPLECYTGRGVSARMEHYSD